METDLIGLISYGVKENPWFAVGLVLMAAGFVGMFVQAMKAK